MRKKNVDSGAVACMINAEIGVVLAVMRRNARWTGSYVADDDQWEHSLVHSLKSLRRKIFAWNQPWKDIDPHLYIQPFLDVIRSDETSAPITGVALSAIYNILSYEAFDLTTSHIAEAMHGLVEAITSCRFEVIDPASEEVVLMKILQVLLAIMKHEGSKVLNDKDLCLVVNTCFRVVHQASTKGELLQRTARHSMHEIVRVIFTRLPELQPPLKNLSGNGSSTPSNNNNIVCEWLQLFSVFFFWSPLVRFNVLSPLVGFNDFSPSTKGSRFPPLL